LICVAALCLFFTVADAQPYRKLTIDDYRGVPYTENGASIAYTNCSIEYSFAVAKREKGYYILNFNIRLTMDNHKSWMDKNRVNAVNMLAEVLKHEQGHYNLAYLEQQELLRTVSKTVFYGDYQNAANNIFYRIDAKYQKLNLAYDEETQHMTNVGQQHSWDLYFKNQLGTGIFCEQLDKFYLNQNTSFFRFDNF